MIHVARQREPSFDPDPGQTRTAIGGYFVEWSVVEPTAAEVEAFVNPPAEVVAASARARAKELISGDRQLARAFRALLRITKPTNRTAVQWRQAFLDAIGADA